MFGRVIKSEIHSEAQTSGNANYFHYKRCSDYTTELS